MTEPPSPDSEDRRRLWPARAVGFLLVVEGFLSVGIGVHLGLPAQWRERFGSLLEIRNGDMTAVSAVFLVISALAFVAALGSFLLRRSAWLLSMFVQLLVLVSTLAYHFREGKGLTDALMAYSVVLVFYLNLRVVRVVLHGSAGEPEDAHG
jgi:hypothetical protein